MRAYVPFVGQVTLRLVCRPCFVQNHERCRKIMCDCAWCRAVGQEDEAAHIDGQEISGNSDG